MQAEIRNLDGKNKELRALKKIPAVVYGKNQEAISIVLDYSEFLKTFRKTWESHIINLQVGKKEIEVLVHDVQKEPVSGDFIHIDFFAITKGEKLTTHIKLSFVWNSIAVKEGGILEELHKEIEVKCLAKDLVDSFEVDLSILNEIEDVFRVSDLKLDSKKYEVLTPENEVLVLIGKPKVHSEDEIVTESTDKVTE